MTDETRLANFGWSGFVDASVCGVRRVESSVQGTIGEGARAWRVYRWCLACSSQSRAAPFGVVDRKRVVDKLQLLQKPRK
jgi:hypothetical protein